MRTLLATLSILAASLVSASAQTVRGEFVGCISDAALDEFMTAVVNSDMRHINALLGSVCVPIKGMQYSIVDRGFLRSQIRVYSGSNSVVLWTVSEAIR